MISTSNAGRGYAKSSTAQTADIIQFCHPERSEGPLHFGDIEITESFVVCSTAAHKMVNSAMDTQTVPSKTTAVDTAMTVLLRDLVDYAGLFPPASLPMPQSVANYDRYLQSEWSWILGRLILPVARLTEFERAFAALPTRAPEKGLQNWRLSALLGSEVEADIDRINEFNARAAFKKAVKRAVVESVEVKVANAADIKRLAAVIPPELATYFEIPLSASEECIAAAADSGRRAKIRTGGETADKFPDPESVTEFVLQCAAFNVPFKATAGLHHPLRSVRRFTYQPESASGMMHGFINVFLAAAFLRAGMAANLAVQLLEEQSPQAFRFTPEVVSWREHKLTRVEIAATRQNAVSFGSCSFTEPVDDLKSLHLL
jgi:hypothetical protein